MLMKRFVVVAAKGKTHPFLHYVVLKGQNNNLRRCFVKLLKNVKHNSAAVWH